MSESYAGKINRKLLKKAPHHQRRRRAGAGGPGAEERHLCQRLLQRALPRRHRRGRGADRGHGPVLGTVEEDCTGKIVLPGFLDAHIHLESSLVSPKEFVKAVLPHGTTTVITDPHEIANVMGTDGIEYMLQATEDLPVDVRFMLPSCVPATPLDESGAVLDYRPSTPSTTIPGSRAWRR